MGIRPYEMAIDRPPVGGDAHIAPPFSYHVSGGAKFDKFRPRCYTVRKDAA